MKYALLMAWRYVCFSWGRSLVLACGIALTMLLPLSVGVLVDEYSEGLAARADATPLVAGTAGSRYDLVLNSLYFSGRVPTPLSMAEVEWIQESKLAQPIPLVVRGTAAKHPIVGTSHDYYSFRGLEPASGSLPLRLGDCVLGAEVGRQLGLDAGGHLLTDQNNLYDISKAYPLRMRVMGVLAANDTPDDHAVFCDVKTTWIIDGLGHGHQDAQDQGDAQVLARDGEKVVLNASIVEYNEVTDANIDSFHFHGEAQNLPLTAVLAIPLDARSRTLLKGRYRVRDEVQLLEPPLVIAELLGFVFRVKVFFDANTALVSVATLLFLSTIVFLSLQVRRRQMQTLVRIGCARATVAKLLGTELTLITLAGLGIAVLLATLLAALAPPLTTMMSAS